MATCLLLFSITLFTNYALANSVDIWFLGIDSRDPTIGIAMRAHIEMRNSSSYSVSIRGVNFDKSVLYSFLLSGYAIKYVCGIDVDRIAVNVHIDGSTQIKGASASLAYVMGILKALNRIDIPYTRWGATGVVSIDGFVDAIGGLSTKIRAAKESGLESVYIPMINGMGKSEDSIVNSVKVIEIASLADLCRGLTLDNSSIEPSLKVLRTINEFFIREAERFLQMAKSIVDNAPGDKKEALSLLYEESSKNVGRALGKGHGYTAASYAFLGYMQILYRYLMLNNTRSGYLIEESEEIVKNALNEFTKFKYIHSSTIPVVVVILDRVTEAQYYIDLYRNATRSSTSLESLQTTLEFVAKAYARSLTVDTWLHLLKLVNSSANGGSYEGGQLIPFNKTYATILNVLRAVSLTIDWGQELAPLSLSAIASTRSSLAKKLDSNLQLRVIDSIKRLYRIHSSYLDTGARAIPYIYYIYFEDLVLEGGDESISVLSMSTLIASITNIVNDAMSRGGMEMALDYRDVLIPYDVRIVVLLLNITLLLLLTASLLYIIAVSYKFKITFKELLKLWII